MPRPRSGIDNFKEEIINLWSLNESNDSILKYLQERIHVTKRTLEHRLADWDLYRQRRTNLTEENMELIRYLVSQQGYKDASAVRELRRLHNVDLSAKMLKAVRLKHGIVRVKHPVKRRRRRAKKQDEVPRQTQDFLENHAQYNISPGFYAEAGIGWPPPFAPTQREEPISSKGDVRAKIWQELRKVAYPDSRFDYDFSRFIADFDGSQAAADKLLSLRTYQDCDTVFITPDNCLEYLREKTLSVGIRVLTTTYGIRRGFLLLDPAGIEKSLCKYASTLDGMERVGKYVSLADIVALNSRIGCMVTGAGAINHKGIRVGKGHGFFDLEWAMLYSLGAVQQETPVVALVHDCQVLEEELQSEEFDTMCDLLFTPTRTVSTRSVKINFSAKKPTCGILWDRLEDGMLEDIPPLQELKTLQNAARE
ncbi:hypothetical protein GGR54DRAFT_639707 [Hypoxylon sp. NC1633]|nr:hypothetical protein GGR54DRAFT_639707 [Hypoxylon sp. NC1633]